MQGHEIIVIGSSAGGVEALQQLVQGFPANLPAAVFIVQHISPHSPSVLAGILQNKSTIPVSVPEDGENFLHSHIYVAPPDQHLLIQGANVRVVRGPTENRHRPAIDPLFRSAAWSYGPRVIGVILSGTLDDGVAGMWAVKSCGGTTVVQDPDDALFPFLPRNAMREVEVDHCLPLKGIPGLLYELAGRAPATSPIPERAERIRIEVESAIMGTGIDDMNRIGAPSVFACPACNGTLWTIEEGVTRYRCHVGHSYLPESLVADQTAQIAAALESALATMEEKANLLRRMAVQHPESSPQKARHLEMARKEEENAAIVRSLLRGIDQ